MPVRAVIFDLDGVLLDSEGVWAGAREQIAREHGGHWDDGAQRRMMGMSSTEWSRYMHEELGVGLPPAQIASEVVRSLSETYRRDLPLIPGAAEAVRRLAAHWPLALASSANRPLIDLVLELADLAGLFRVTLSSEEVPRGKPAPDVYLEAAARLRIDPASTVAVEDSTNGVRSARAAGCGVIAIPDRAYPPTPDALALADAVLGSIGELTVEAVEALRWRSRTRRPGRAGPGPGPRRARPGSRAPRGSGAR